LVTPAKTRKVLSVVDDASKDRALEILDDLCKIGSHKVYFDFKPEIVGDNDLLSESHLKWPASLAMNGARCQRR